MRKPTASVEVRSARIEFGDGDVRVGDAIRLRATTAFETDSCTDTIAQATELINDEVVVDDAPFEFELHGTCAFTREFDYSG